MKINVSNSVSSSNYLPEKFIRSFLIEEYAERERKVRTTVGSSDYATTNSGAAAVLMAVLNTINRAAHRSMLTFLGFVKLIEIASIAHSGAHVRVP